MMLGARGRGLEGTRGTLWEDVGDTALPLLPLRKVVL